MCVRVCVHACVRACVRACVCRHTLFIFLSYVRRIVVRIDSWEVGSQYPNGHFVRSIGPKGNIDTETAVILTEYCLSASTFSKALLEGEGGNTAQTKHTPNSTFLY